MSERDSAREAGYRAVEVLYHALLTGLILTTVSRRSGADAAELVFRTFRRQHLEKFLPGLAKLGLTGLPHAVACAQYHYLSNHLGGVRVEYMYESDRKAWVRYVPPRWIYEGTAICGVPREVSRAMLRGWHAHNGVTLGNPRLGFVCTKQTTDGQPGLEGYYLEHDRDLAPEERLRFAPGEDGPDFDPARAPRVEGADWPALRLRKITRNYAMDYVRTILPVLAETFGPAEARHLGGVTGRLIGMQYYAETAALLGVAPGGAEGFARYLCAIGGAQDDVIDWRREGTEVIVRQRGWRLMADVPAPAPSAFEGWNALWEGALSVHDRRVAMVVTRRLDQGDDCFEWRLRGR
ncbi:MAG TPA: hypothetical protein VJX92_23225 [Methylomirabilota bacterium]|nr:hypothetical protein [Methylomirabilota bacterium]